MKSFNRKMEQLSRDFHGSICKDTNIYAFAEGLPMDNKWGILVPIASAIRLSNNNNYIVEDANHLTICKPPSKEHISYSKLLECLKLFMKDDLKIWKGALHELKEGDSLYMHEQLRDLGQNIATEVTISRFIWKPYISLQKNQVVKDLEGIIFKECEILPSFFQKGSKEFDNLRLLDLTKSSPNIVENFIQGQDLNNLRWLRLHECKIPTLPNNLVNCCHLRVLHITNCDYLQLFFDILSHGFNMPISINMKELFISISKLNILLELNLSGLHQVTRIAYIYWPIECTPKP
ncbi:unnamed protein product [Sphagnum troendelagicum]|uniref:Uncharacterized protein n=1 Tax=Sphagnum troendelagicum TaxID=128251 RepID=A0ABP0U967_9BRYO